MSNQITDYQLGLKTRIQESLFVINSLLLEARKNDLEVDISTPHKTIGRDGTVGCKDYWIIDVKLFSKI